MNEEQIVTIDQIYFLTPAFLPDINIDYETKKMLANQMIKLKTTHSCQVRHILNEEQLKIISM